MNDRKTLMAAGVFGAVGVGLGAFGAHGLRDILLERGMANTWETAVRYHLFHAFGLLVIALWLRQNDSRKTALFSWVARSWMLGIVLFSGSLYWLALGGPRWLGPVTPLGGVSFLVGWILLIVVAARKAPDL